jgi:hypothetical protein
MYLHSIRLSFVSLLVFIIFQISDSGQKLHYQFNQGKTCTYSTRIDTKTSAQMMGQELRMSSGVDFDYSMRMVRSDGHLYTLQVTFEKFDVHLHVPLMGFNDSTIAMKEYIGKRILVLMTDRGRILSIDQVDSLPLCRIQLIANLTPLSIFRKLFFELPEEDMEIHGSWKKNVPDTVIQGNITMVTKQRVEFTIVGAEKKNDYDCWKVLITGSSTMEGSGTQGANTVNVDGIIKNRGSVLIAPGDGILVSAEQFIDNDLTTTITGPEMGASTMTINTTIQTDLLR